MKTFWHLIENTCWGSLVALSLYMGFIYIRDELTAGAFLKREWPLYLILFGLLVVGFVAHAFRKRETTA